MAFSPSSSAFRIKSQSGGRASLSKSCLFMSSNLPKPKGCAAVPYEKKKVAVFGAGGYLGATIFGFLQRASSLYGTGIGGPSIPRAISATATASESLNKILIRCFALAYAGENMFRLTNMQDASYVAQSLKGMDAVIVGTMYQLESRPVTGNTYEKGPNDKTYEFYLDSRYNARTDVSADDVDVHISLFRNTMEACKEADVKHVVVIETPNTMKVEEYAKVLDEVGVPFTYIHANCSPGSGSSGIETTKDYTFEKGIQGDLDIESFTLADNYMVVDGYKAGDWMENLVKEREVTSATDSVIYREDVAALAVQSLMSLDWSKRRCLEMSTKGNLDGSVKGENERVLATRPPKYDKEWCINSEILAQKLSVIEE